MSRNCWRSSSSVASLPSQTAMLASLPFGWGHRGGASGSKGRAAGPHPSGLARGGSTSCHLCAMDPPGDSAWARTTAVAGEESRAAGGLGNEDRQETVLSFRFNHTLHQTWPPPSVNSLSLPLPERENKVHILHSCFILTNHTQEKISLLATAKEKEASWHPLRLKHCRDFHG